MERQFHKSIISCMQTIAQEVQNQELTQEVRLTDGMPDIGKVLACWGQLLVRSKEWHTGNIGASGGVMAWILYAPEEEGAVQSVAAWLPFQSKWDIPETQREGMIQIAPLLRGIDARSISARKIMVRAGIGLVAEAMVPEDIDLYQADEDTDDVQLLKNTYPIRIPTEMGEKAFFIDEAISLPESVSGMQKIVRYELCPEVLEQKVISDKVVFRGAAKLHILYLGADNRLHTWDTELPFSQYDQLDSEHNADSTAQVCLAITNLELEQAEEGNLNLKAGILGQYVIFDNQMMELTEDAYSNLRDVKPEFMLLRVPAQLDCETETVTARHNEQLGNITPIDLSFYPDHPRCYREEDTATGEMSGVFQLLYYDENDALSSGTFRWEDNRMMNVADNAKISATVQPSGSPQATVAGENALMEGTMRILLTTTCREPLNMMAGLELGELKELNADRPSLVLRRMGNYSLWELAKASGSTVEAIQKANNLQQQPDSNRMLIIPVS